MIFSERLFYRFIATAIFVSIFGCAGAPPTPDQIFEAQDRLDHYTRLHHTGPVTVIDISVSYCEPSNGGKSGTGVCDRSITLMTPDHRVSNMGLCRTGQWPPVWHGMHADIFFKLRQGDIFEDDDHDCALIQYAEEMK